MLLVLIRFARLLALLLMVLEKGFPRPSLLLDFLFLHLLPLRCAPVCIGVPLLDLQVTGVRWAPRLLALGSGCCVAQGIMGSRLALEALSRCALVPRHYSLLLPMVNYLLKMWMKQALLPIVIYLPKMRTTQSWVHSFTLTSWALGSWLSPASPLTTSAPRSLWTSAAWSCGSCRTQTASWSRDPRRTAPSRPARRWTPPAWK
ncbi:unnamed protein product [Prorocentrum cordatum]|uniref:Secreted protein n=1 Tax=Prorocentrum cordatum TaxID=2364126 RepID=A0ABN9SQA9_9DINO|nr:unnamed protein product [Polarella glacialis]